MAVVDVTNIYFDTTFNLTTSSAPVLDFDVVSPTTFPLNAISAANSYIYFKILDYNGDTIYQNSAFDNSPVYTDPDIIGSAPTTFLNAAAALIPTNSDGSIITGEYTITVLQRDNSQVVTDTYQRVVTKSYDYTQTATDVSVDIDIFTPLLTLTDGTTYAVLDPIDNTILNPTITRAWKLYYPPILELSPATSTTNPFITNVFYEGVQTYKLTTSLTYEYQTDTTDCSFLVLDSIVTTDTFEVDANALTDYYCCLKAVEQRFYDSLCSSSMALAKNREDYQTVMAYAEIIRTATQNGEYSDVETYITRMKEIANCDEDCECGDSDGIPRQITGVGNPTITQVISEVADGATSVFPTLQADKNKLIGKSYTNGEFIVFIDGGELRSSSITHSFSTATGAMTLTGFAPANGVIVVFNILK